jgi:hypothetical protein
MRFRLPTIGRNLAVSTGMLTQSASSRIEILIGRSLAMCVHPYAAWRSHSTRGRVFVFCAYLAASYAAVLGVLELTAF